jgi:hypothetical protein
MWVRQRSVQELSTMLFGYSLALQVHNTPEPVDFQGASSPFAQWLCETRGWSMALGWATAIEANAQGGTPLELFFSLLDEYRTRPVPAACPSRAEISGIERHQDDQQTHPDQKRGS